MPILRVEIVGVLPETVRTGLAARIADAAGEVLASRPQGTWVLVRFADRKEYAENQGGTAESVQPVIVTVLRRELPEPPVLSDEAARLTAAIAQACARPVDNVHLIYEPAAAGRVAFGGALVE